MAYTDSINVRLSPEMKARLETLSRDFGVKSSDLIRTAVEEAILRLEASDVIEIRRKSVAAAKARLNEIHQARSQKKI